MQKVYLSSLYRKAERKGRTKAEVDTIICWLTGYSPEELQEQVDKQIDIETFFAEVPELHPSRSLIKGVICGVRVEDIEEETMKNIRYLDKLIDELAKGKKMEKIFARYIMRITSKPSEITFTGLFLYLIDHSIDKNKICLNESSLHVVKRSVTKTNLALKREWRGWI
ncbi:hypothetical protein BsIDN1_03230 [Bacillus safensis]|uniref:DUF2200 domain-containing protein n=1 Tax=Bacillus safensis TaxID=561879 RepID=A0A5S9M1R3_BACIA|nr:hypothetical protein BsIDN1_03230 [Bacillus safensis]